MPDTSISSTDPDRPSFRKRVERTAGRIALLLLVGPLRALPLSTARTVGKGLGEALYLILGRYRRVAHKNLALVYKDTPARERTRMAHAVFRHFGEMAAEFLNLPRLSLAEVDAMTCIEGADNLRQALAANRGAFIITGHFGNWEFMARWITLHGYTLNVVARDARDPAATKLMTDIRQGNGANVLYRGSSARAILQALKRNELVAILPDQNAADVFVPFLGVNTGTVDGPAVLHLKTGAPIVLSWCWRDAGGKFHITFEPAETIEPSGNKADDVARVMTLINARLEAQIRKHPTQWLWLHDRWKATPEVFAVNTWGPEEVDNSAQPNQEEAGTAHDTARR